MNQTAVNPNPSGRAPAPAEPGPVLVISSHVMAGAVGNRAAAFTLERLGHPVWEVPTVILPWHPGHGPSTRQVIEAEAFASSLDDLARHPDFASLGAVLSGYLGSVAQVEAVARIVDKLKAANPEAVYLCDPVVGEESGLYIPTDIAEAIRAHLVPRADIITPNRFEFNWLTDSAERHNDGLVIRARDYGRPLTLITSAYPLMRNAIGNLLFRHASEAQKELAILCEHPAVANPQSGTGDMFAAHFLAQKLKGRSDEDALKFASSGVLEVVARSSAGGYRDLELVRFGDRFYHPMAMVHMRQIGGMLKVSPVRRARKANADKQATPEE